MQDLNIIIQLQTLQCARFVVSDYSVAVYIAPDSCPSTLDGYQSCSTKLIAGLDVAATCED